MENRQPDIVEPTRRFLHHTNAGLSLTRRTSRCKQTSKDHVPPPADRFEALVDRAVFLVPKDRNKILAGDLSVVLDPTTLPRVNGIGAKLRKETSSAQP